MCFLQQKRCMPKWRVKLQGKAQKQNTEESKEETPKRITRTNSSLLGVTVRHSLVKAQDGCTFDKFDQYCTKTRFLI